MYINIHFLVFCRTQTRRKADAVGGFADFAPDFLSMLLLLLLSFLPPKIFPAVLREQQIASCFSPACPSGGWWLFIGGPPILFVVRLHHLRVDSVADAPCKLPPVLNGQSLQTAGNLYAPVSARGRCISNCQLALPDALLSFDQIHSRGCVTVAVMYPRCDFTDV